jgi:hypothetical protein
MGHRTKDKANIATAKAILDLMNKGHEILTPFSDHLTFDLVAYRGGQFLRLQVKYSVLGTLGESTGWSNSRCKHRRRYTKEDFDYYAAYLPEVDCVVYPSVAFAGCRISQRVPKSGVTFYWYEDFLDFTDSAPRRTYRDFGADEPDCLPPTARKVVWPTREELSELIWKIPLTKIAEQFGVTDKAVARWVSVYDLETPPRGYWLQRRPLSVTDALESPKLQEEVQLL